MSAAMDMFLNASDSLPFPDVLDIDIKSEMDLLVGGHNDFSGFNFNSLEPLEFEDVHEIKWFNSSSSHSILDFNGEDSSAMVNPNAVMPVMSLAPSIGRSPSPAIRESHLTFSPASIKITSIKADAAVVKTDLIHRLESIETAQKKRSQIPVVKTVTKVTPILAKPSLKPIAIRTTQTNPTIVIKNAIRQMSAPIITHVGNAMTIRTVQKSILSQNVQRKAVSEQNSIDQLEGIRIYPKPAYSYSCLIALALKNSRTGSLPVSEIYNFMCKHFPYFKTAPNGWKNSVRHNLSLNKCFEKIEKPALNGGQRKGCLWAMNPSKISKMDEEVQKWSRKDPCAIKKAMVNPETLEALEKGELKFSCSYDDEEHEIYADSCGSVESEEGSDIDVDPQEEVELEEPELDIGEMHLQYVQIGGDEVQYAEIQQDSFDADKELLRVEMVLAQQELEYERTSNNKRRKTILI